MAADISVHKAHKSPVFMNIIIAYYFFIAGIALLMALIYETPFLSTGTMHIFSNMIWGIYARFPFTWGLYSPPSPTYMYIPTPFYEEIITIIFALLGYLLLKRKALGYYAGLFISVYAVVFGTTSSLRITPWSYLDHVSKLGGIGNPDIVRILVILNICLLITIPFYLFSQRKLFIGKQKVKK